MYNKEFAKIYDLLYSHKDYEKEVNYILTKCRKGTLLDVGAGTLSHSILLSNHFKGILATDYSQSMLDVGMTKVKSLNINNINVFCGDLSEIKDSFDTVISMFNVVNHILTIEEIKSFFGLIVRLMKPDGVFVFDAWGGLANIIDPPLEVDERLIETDRGPIRLGVKTKTCLKTLTANMKMTAAYGGYEVETILKHRIWTMDVLIELAENAGLTIEQRSDTFIDNKDFSEFSRKMVFVCTKK